MRDLESRVSYRKLRTIIFCDHCKKRFKGRWKIGLAFRKEKQKKDQEHRQDREENRGPRVQDKKDEHLFLTFY